MNDILPYHMKLRFKHSHQQLGMLIILVNLQLRCQHNVFNIGDHTMGLLKLNNQWCRRTSSRVRLLKFLLSPCQPHYQDLLQIRSKLGGLKPYISLKQGKLLTTNLKRAHFQMQKDQESRKYFQICWITRIRKLDVLQKKLKIAKQSNF